jgi:flagellar biosynthesis protein FlhG
LVSGVTDVQFARKRKLIDSFLNINADYILLDLGSGCSSNVIDFFLISNSGFVVTTGQTASVLNAYGFLKNVVYRFFQRAFASHKEISKYLKKSLKEKKPGTSLAVSAIIKNIEEIDTSEGEKARKYVSVLKPKLIVNMAESPDELVIIEKLRDLVKSTLDLDVELMGLVYADNSIDESLEERLPLVIYKNDTMAARDIARIALKIIHSDRFPDMPLALDYYKDTFELTQIEAHNDFEELESLRKNEEELNLEELLTIISAQEKQINELRGTIRMLTMRSR